MPQQVVSKLTTMKSISLYLPANADQQGIKLIHFLQKCSGEVTRATEVGQEEALLGKSFYRYAEAYHVFLSMLPWSLSAVTWS